MTNRFLLICCAIAGPGLLYCFDVWPFWETALWTIGGIWTAYNVTAHLIEEDRHA